MPKQERLNEKPLKALKDAIIRGLISIRDWRDSLRDRKQEKSRERIMSLAKQALALVERQRDLTEEEDDCVELDGLSASELEKFFQNCACESSSSIQLPLPSDDDDDSSFLRVQLPLPSDDDESSHFSRAKFPLPLPVCAFTIQLPHVA